MDGSEFKPLSELEIFFSPHMSKGAMGLIKNPVKWVHVVFSGT
jgi:hypothetical protein